MRRILLIVCMLIPFMAFAQDDFGIWTTIEAEKKMGRNISIGANGEFRTRNDAKTADRWAFGVDVSYKPVKFIKVGIAYTFINDNRKEDIDYKKNGDYNHWRPSYWTAKHRISFDVAGEVKAGRFTFGLRERWQYTYRPEKTVQRYDFDNEAWEDKTYSSNNKHVLRSRLQIEYDIPKSKFNPYTSVELYNNWAVQKVRYTLGVDWKITKKHTVGTYYRYQTINTDNGDDTANLNSHILGINYKLKF